MKARFLTARSTDVVSSQMGSHRRDADRVCVTPAQRRRQPVTLSTVKRAHMASLALIDLHVLTRPPKSMPWKPAKKTVRVLTRNTRWKGKFEIYLTHMPRHFMSWSQFVKFAVTAISFLFFISTAGLWEYHFRTDMRCIVLYIQRGYPVHPRYQDLHFGGDKPLLFP